VTIVLIAFLTLGGVAAAPGAVVAQNEPIPAAYYGSITTTDGAAVDGVEITAEINGEERGSITAEDGTYGGSETLDEKLVVNGEEGEQGDTVEFFVDGEPAETDPGSISYQPDAVQQVDLTIDTSSGDDGGDDSDSSGGGGGGSSTGGQEGGDDAPPTVAEIRNTLDLVEPSTTTRTPIVDNDPDTPGTQVTPEGTESVRLISFQTEGLSGNVDINEYINPPQQIRNDVASSVTAAGAAPEGSSLDVVSVADITPDNEAAEESAATVTFAIPASEVDDPDEVAVVKETYDFEQQQNTWSALPTTVENVGDEEITVSTDAESFSLFAVAEVNPNDGAVDDSDQQQDDGQQDDGQQDGDSSTALLVVGLLVVLAAIGAFLYTRQNN